MRADLTKVRQTLFNLLEQRLQVHGKGTIRLERSKPGAEST